jgi:hypothetical protein
MNTKIAVPCDRGGPAGRHRWRWDIVLRDRDGQAVYDRRCLRCGRWWLDVIDR